MFLLSQSSEKDRNAFSISAVISTGPEDTGCPSLSLRLQPLLGIWGPPRTIVLSYRKYGSLLTPSIHWVSCVRLPRPVFIFFAFCLYPPYRSFRTSTKKYKREDGTISNYWEDTGIVISSEIHFSLPSRTQPFSYCDLSFGVAINFRLSIRSAEKTPPT